jgi:hypothetical protein
MKRRFAVAGLVTFAFFVAASLSIPLSNNALAAQTGKKSSTQSKSKVDKDHAQKGKGGGSDQNIKSDSDANDPGKPVPAPGKKGGEKSKGQAGGCAVVLDNRTGWFIRIYVDGTFRGTIAPWGDSYCYTGAGRTQLYAVATFNDGSRYTWGPRLVNCYGSYTWQLFE